MDHFTVVVVIGASTLLLGLVIGLIIGRSGSDRQQCESLKSQLDSTSSELAEYKRNVSEHFTRTADLVNTLTESYQQVHHHLAQSANQLCDEELLTHRLQSPLAEQALPEQADELEPPPKSAGKDTPQKASTDGAQAVEPPKDYAPKTDPDAEGTLSESFGLKPGEEEALEHDPSKTADHAKS
ncbi:YhcB family protein [Motiliproteus sp. MSK22-1]|uniref:YhcB family protein n=1 Tax=Motiliproteus sp. MSK22-1 TaxID=1897630 RepID=UPI00097688B1|nr:DUF1043 family protein [Motiliproteus sp. MSK22-1]OMH30349.1 hypothetical protein BGP75_18375 [Motiliproteus sp. MSK22-1]